MSHMHSSDICAPRSGRATAAAARPFRAAAAAAAAAPRQGGDLVRVLEHVGVLPHHVGRGVRVAARARERAPPLREVPHVAAVQARVGDSEVRAVERPPHHVGHPVRPPARARVTPPAPAPRGALAREAPARPRAAASMAPRAVAHPSAVWSLAIGWRPRTARPPRCPRL